VHGHGGITGGMAANGEISNCYNLGEVICTGPTTAYWVGGIAGTNFSHDGSGYVEERASIISNCYNNANVSSSGTRVGGITGVNKDYCSVKKCYIGSEVVVKYGTTQAEELIGTANNYVGQIIGETASTDTTYVDDIGVLTAMPTVYHVVNGMSDGDSQYWSKTNVNQPKLLWEK